MLHGACAHINILDLFVRSIASPKMDFKTLAIRRSYTTVDVFDESSVNIHSAVPLITSCLTASTATPYMDEAISAAAPIPADWKMLRHG